MKRKAGYQSSRQQTGIHVECVLGKIIFPKNREEFNGFLISEAIICKQGKPGNEKIKINGNVPLLSKNFVYKLLLFKETEGNKRPKYNNSWWYVPEYQIKDCKVEPRPLTWNMLVSIFTECDINNPRDTATNIWKELGMKDRKDTIMLEEMEMFSWYEKVSNQSEYFRFQNATILFEFWSASQLKGIKSEDLVNAGKELLERPELFCFSWRNKYNIPILTINDLKRWEELQQFDEIPQKLYHTLRFLEEYYYPKVYSLGHCYISLKELKSQKRYKGLVTYMQKKEIGKIVFEEYYEHDNSGSQELVKRYESRFYLYGDYDNQCRFKTMFINMQERHRQRLEEISTMRPLIMNHVIPENFSEEQRKAVYSAISLPFSVITGDAGTGKTTVARIIHRAFCYLYLDEELPILSTEKSKHRPKYISQHVLPVAMYGKAAARLRQCIGHSQGYTLDRITVMLNNDLTVKPVRNHELDYKECKVLLVDESSTLTLKKLVDLMEKLPELESIVLIGDEKQMNPIEHGDVLGSMLKFTFGTDHSVILKTNHRTDNASKILLDLYQNYINGKNFLHGKWLIKSWSTDLSSDHPLTIIKRTNNLVDDIGPIIEKYQEDLTKIQIITQTNRICDQINKVPFDVIPELKRQKTLLGGMPKRTMFFPGEKLIITENFYGNKTGKAHTKSNPVMRGETYILEEVYDTLVNAKGLKINLKHTQEQKKNHMMKRILVLRPTNTTGTAKKKNIQICTSDYPLFKLKRATCITITSSQGTEVDVCVVYIHKGFSHTFTSEELYTAITRPKKRLIIVCQHQITPGGDIFNSDIVKVFYNKSPVRRMNPWAFLKLI